MWAETVTGSRSVRDRRPGASLLLFLPLAAALGLAVPMFPFTSDEQLWLACAAPVLALMVVFWAAGRVALLSPSIVFTVLYVTLTHVGAVLFYLKDPVENGNFLVMSSVTLLAFAAGNYIAALASRRRVRRLATSLPVPHNDLTGHRLWIWSAFAVIGVTGALFFLWAGARRVGGVPVLGLLRESSGGNVRAYAASRLDFSRVPGQGYVFNLYAVMLPIATLAFAMRSIGSRNRARTALVVVLAVLALMASGAAGYRGQLAVLALLVIVGLSYYYGTVWSSVTRRILLGTILAIGLLSSLAYASGPSSSSVGDILLVRVFKVQALGPQYVYGFVPPGGPFSGGRELLQDLAGILPGSQQGFSSELPALRGVKSLNNPIGVPAELYLNFGPVGLALGMLLLGILCHRVHRRLLERRTTGRIALGAGITTALGYGAMAGIVGTLFQFGVVTVVSMAAILAFFDLSVSRHTVTRPRRPASRHPATSGASSGSGPPVPAAPEGRRAVTSLSTRR